MKRFKAIKPQTAVIACHKPTTKSLALMSCALNGQKSTETEGIQTPRSTCNSFGPGKAFPYPPTIDFKTTTRTSKYAPRTSQNGTVTLIERNNPSAMALMTPE